MKQIIQSLKCNIKLVVLIFLVTMPSFTAEAKKNKYDNGDYYEGKWVNGKPNGEGVMTYADGRIYSGNWVNGKPNGEGIMTYADGRIYSGKWNDGKISGQCVVTFVNGDKYEGAWNNEQPNGRGVMLYANGDKYSGTWSKGRPNGSNNCIMTYANGDKFEGSWKDGEKYGVGTMTYSNGDKFEGGWKDGEKYGKGKMTYANYDEFECVWMSDKENGKGYYFKSGHLFQDGIWKNGEFFSGDEVINTPLPSGVRRVAKLYKDGVVVNTVIYYTDGRKYTGEIDGALRHGDGILAQSGYEILGKWENDKLISGSCSGSVTEEFPGPYKREESRKLTFPFKFEKSIDKELLKLTIWHPENGLSWSIEQLGLLENIKILLEILEDHINKFVIKENEDIIKKDIENDLKLAPSRIWTPSQLSSLKYNNPAKFNSVVNAVIIHGQITDISQGKSLEWNIFLQEYVDKIHYDVTLNNSVIIRFDKNGLNAISQRSRGDVVYALCLASTESSYDGKPIFIYNWLDRCGIFNSIGEVCDFLSKQRESRPSPNLYKIEAYSKNIYL